jgi:hypothetical protein
MMRLAAQVARGDLVEARRRLVRSVVLLSVILILTTVALALAATALAIALAGWIGLVPAFLLISALASITALILAIMFSTRTQKPRLSGKRLLDLSARKLPDVNPLAVVVGALAIGLLLGRRRR